MTLTTISKKDISNQRYKRALVLSGGGMRGFAHIGVIEELLAHGKKPDIIVGTSIGAVAGVCYAAGKSIDEMKEFFFGLSVYKLLRPKWKAGLLDTKKIIETILKFAGVSSFNELSIPVLITATDINKGEEKVFSSGKLQQALQASIAVPGIFAPVVIGKSLYVDGGASNPIPTHLVMDAKEIYVVDIAFKFEKVTSSSSPLTVIKNAMFSLQKHSIKHLDESAIYMKPPLQEFDLYEYATKARKTMYVRGKNCAKKVLDSHKPSNSKKKLYK